jgi:hypothetical protein
VRLRCGAGGIRALDPLVPQLGFSRAICPISAATLASMHGRPPLGGWVHRQRTSRRCQRSSVPGALRTVADFLAIDEDLNAVAAEACPPLKEEPAAGLAGRITALPAAEKDKLLTMVADGEGPQAQALLLRRFRGGAPDQSEPAQPARTAAQLRAAAGARRSGRGESEARARRAEEERAATAKAAAYNERLDHLAARAEAAWREAESLIETKKPRDYTLRSRCCATCPLRPAAMATTTRSPSASCNWSPGTSANHR